MGYSFSQHILMYKQSLGTLRCWCEAVIWITGVTNGWKEAFNQLFHGFGFFFLCSDTRMFVFTVPPLVCWILSGGSQLTDRTKTRFSSLSPENLMGSKSPERPVLSPTGATPMDTQNSNCSSYPCKVQSVNSQMQTSDAFSFSALLSSP